MQPVEYCPLFAKIHKYIAMVTQGVCTHTCAHTLVSIVDQSLYSLYCCSPVSDIFTQNPSAGDLLIPLSTSTLITFCVESLQAYIINNTLYVKHACLKVQRAYLRLLNLSPGYSRL